MIQTGNEKTRLSTNMPVMFNSWAVLQVTTALCCSSVYHGKQGTEAKQPSTFLSQLPFEPYTECICRFDLVVGMMILPNTGLCPKHTTQGDQRDAEIKQAAGLRDNAQSPKTLSVWTGTNRSIMHQDEWGGWEDWLHNLEKARLCFTTVTLSQYEEAQLQWSFQPSHMYVYVHADLWAYPLSWIQFYKASVKVN